MIDFLYFTGNNFTGDVPLEIGVVDPTLFDLINASSLDSGAALKNISSPQYQALWWLSNNAKLGSYSVYEKLQRYALAVLYFSTGGPIDWLQANNWMSDKPVCQWDTNLLISLSGVTSTSCGKIGSVDSGVTSLKLRENNLVGELPAELYLLSDSLGTSCL